jgi:hypothetical protein
VSPVAEAVDPFGALTSVWDRVGPHDRANIAVHALIGIPPEVIAELALLVAAASADADRLIRTTPGVLRHLSSSTTMVAERCVAHVRGPVLWSETLNARAHTLGSDDVFVCGVLQRDYDTTENEVLLSALDLVGRAGAILDHEATEFLDPTTVALAAARSTAARSLRAERSLDGVRRNRAGNMQVHRVRNGRHSKQYQPALSVLNRRTEPFRGRDLILFTDPKTVGQLRGLVLMCAALERRGMTIGDLAFAGAEVSAGPLRYRNWRHATEQGNFGLLIGPVLVDTPGTDDPTERAAVLADLEARAGRRKFCVVTNDVEADLAVDLARDASAGS